VNPSPLPRPELRSGTAAPPPSPALLIAGHGTASQAGVAEYFALADRVRAIAPQVPVGAGFLELAPPPLSVAIGDLVAQGHRHVVVVPLVLTAAGHAKTDIPAGVVAARRDFPDIRFSYARHLGIHPDLLAVVDERLTATVPPPQRTETAVLLVGRGSSDPDANADLHKVARLLWEGRDWPTVEACFVGITGPRVPEGLERCRRLGHRRIAVVPYFLFTGVLERRIHAQAAAFARQHPKVDVQVAHYLGPDDRVAGLVLERYREALRGEARMTCDTCVHRVALPGFAHKVGAPFLEHG
jgi:sirohydrochlorin cobaltochelatase